MKSKYKTLLSNTAIFAVSNVLSKVILSLLLPLYTRQLTPAEYGVAELVTTISQLVVPICSLSIQDALFRFGMDSRQKAAKALKVSSTILFFAMLLLVGVSVAFHWYEAMSEWIWFFFFISAFTMIRSALSLYTKATDRTLVFSIDSVFYNLSLAVLNIIFLVGLQWRLAGYFAAMVVANLLSMAFLILKNNLIKDLRGVAFDKDLMKEMIRYSAPLILNSISWGLINVVNRVMLTEHCGEAAAGVYSAASKIPSLLSLVTGVFTQAWTLSAVKDYETEKDAKFYENIFLVTHLGVMLFSLMIFLMNNNVLAWVMGADFIDSIKYVPLLLAGSVFLTYSNYYSSIYAAARRSKNIMFSSLGGGILTVVLNIVLIPQIGIIGACIATCLGYAYIGLYRMIDCQRIFPLKLGFVRFALSAAVLVGVTLMATVDLYPVLASLVGLALIVLLYLREIRSLIGTFWRVAQKMIGRKGKKAE